MSQDAQGSHPGAEPLEPASSRSVGDTLAGLDELPVGEHVARFEAVHDALRARLAGGSSDGGTA